MIIVCDIGYLVFWADWYYLFTIQWNVCVHHMVYVRGRSQNMLGQVQVQVRLELLISCFLPLECKLSAPRPEI